jgi:hypothetical protein
MFVSSRLVIISRAVGRVTAARTSCAIGQIPTATTGSRNFVTQSKYQWMPINTINVSCESIFVRLLNASDFELKMLIGFYFLVCFSCLSYYGLRLDQ